MGTCRKEDWKPVEKIRLEYKIGWKPNKIAGTCRKKNLETSKKKTGNP